jgi:hypothetical protein
MDKTSTLIQTTICKDEANKSLPLNLLSMCDVKVFLTFTFVVKILQVTRGC